MYPRQSHSRSLHEQGALADADRRIGADPGQARLEVAYLDPVSFATKLGQSRPALASRWHVLPLVVTDRALSRRLNGGRLLDTASATDPGRHDANLDAGSTTTSGRHLRPAAPAFHPFLSGRR